MFFLLLLLISTPGKVSVKLIDKVADPVEPPPSPEPIALVPVVDEAPTNVVNVEAVVAPPASE